MDRVLRQLMGHWWAWGQLVGCMHGHGWPCSSIPTMLYTNFGVFLNHTYYHANRCLVHANRAILKEVLSHIRSHIATLLLPLLNVQQVRRRNRPFIPMGSPCCSVRLAIIYNTKLPSFKEPTCNWGLQLELGHPILTRSTISQSSLI